MFWFSNQQLYCFGCPLWCQLQQAARDLWWTEHLAAKELDGFPSGLIRDPTRSKWMVNTGPCSQRHDSKLWCCFITTHCVNRQQCAIIFNMPTRAVIIQYVSVVHGLFLLLVLQTSELIRATLWDLIDNTSCSLLWQHHGCLRML